MKYIRAILDENKFVCRLSFNFEGKYDIDLVDIDAILDTGCSHSHISADLIYIFFSEEERLGTKGKYMRIRPKGIGTGVESNGKLNNTDTNDVNNPRIMISQKCYNVNINGVYIGNRYLNVSYDTSRVALIGMSILKDWDIHIGKNKQGETVFLGCPYNQLNQEYYIALNNEFGLQQNINAAIINNKI